MSLALSPAKNPRKVAAGLKAARARWGPEPRVLRLDTLPPEYRRAVMALLDAARRAESPQSPQT